jgi:hypothetical protein
MSYVLGEKASLGLDVGDYVVRVDSVEGGTSTTNNPKIQFNTVVAFDAENGTPAGSKGVWSYTYQPDYLGIISGDLIRSQAFAKNDTLSGDAKADALVIEQRMRGQFYLIAVRTQKKNPDRTNTTIVGPYSGGAVAAATPPPAAQFVPAPVAAAPAASGFGAPPPTGPPPSAAIPPPPPPIAGGFGAATPPASDPNTQEVTAQQIAALEAAAAGKGAWPTLGTRAIAQLHEIGWDAIAALYENGTAPRHPQAGAAPTGFGAPPPVTFAGV